MHFQAQRHREPASDFARQLLHHYARTRDLTVNLIAPLSEADTTVQSMADASPAKWHLAHTTWFFETFVLSAHVPGYECFDARFAYLFNSYYDAAGARIGRGTRGLLTRPSLDSVLCYRDHVDEAIGAAMPGLPFEALKLIELGCHHEQQHQELLVTDILHLFAQNPLLPAIWPASQVSTVEELPPLRWIEGESGLLAIGHKGNAFAFDCERPKHLAMVYPHALANRLVTNAEWQEFIDDGGYRSPTHWLSEGWAWVQQHAIEAPLYWLRNDDRKWARQFELDGLNRLDPRRPVQHVSFYEADAFARWAGARLPTEVEWESAALQLDVDQGPFMGTAGPVKPRMARGEGLLQMFGEVWQWTASAFMAYPGFRPDPGAVGEYNGKFMSGQYVLRGGSCATPRGHVRASYRNFFYPHQRWQFTGLRLARDL